MPSVDAEGEIGIGTGVDADVGVDGGYDGGALSPKEKRGILGKIESVAKSIRETERKGKARGRGANRPGYKDGSPVIDYNAGNPLSGGYKGYHGPSESGGGDRKKPPEKKESAAPKSPETGGDKPSIVPYNQTARKSKVLDRMKRYERTRGHKSEQDAFRKGFK